MIPNEIQEIFHERAKKLWDQWWEEKKKNPVFIDVRFNPPLKPGTRIIVKSYPQECIDYEPEDKYFLEQGLLLIDAMLTSSTCDRLAIVLDHIQGFQGIPLHESIAFLMFFHMLHVDLQRACSKEASLFFHLLSHYESLEECKESTGGAKLQPDRTHPAAWTLNQVLDFWYSFGGKFARRFPALDTREVGRWCYLRIPPVWVPARILEKCNEQLARLGEPVEPIKVPVLVEASRKIL
jgi:hypothetical protein